MGVGRTNLYYITHIILPPSQAAQCRKVYHPLGEKRRKWAQDFALDPNTRPATVKPSTRQTLMVPYIRLVTTD